MSIRTLEDNADEPRLRTELDDGRTVDIEITGSPNNKRRVDVSVDGGQTWIFAVEDRTAGLIDLHGAGQPDEVPNWIEPLLQRIGIEGVEE
ncbi:hypothetical protein [Natrinema sp. CGMCC1.2065]|uniref:hypothetical protein n=1 Tax=Natrinema sp. CGMCC1.2065 TaxID=3445767 RepID=UPI003F49E477